MNAHARSFMDKITDDDVVEAEQNVLACILANNEVLNQCGLEEIDFADPLHQSVFSASQKLYSSRGSRNLDVVTGGSWSPDEPRGLQ